MSRAFRHAKNEFRAAQQAVDRMRHARDFNGFEIAWRDFLSAIEKTWIKVERLCRTAPGFQQWQRSFKDQRSSDPLLQYVYQARHVDQHTVAEIVSLTPGRSTIVDNTPPGQSLHIKHLEIRGGQIVNYVGNQPLRQIITSPRIDLLPVENRGTVSPIPTEHLGTPISSPSAAEAAMLTLKFYENFVLEAERRFASHARN